MQQDDNFRIRPGRIRTRGAQRDRGFIYQALASAQKAGATIKRGGISAGHSRFGRGRQATHAANRLLTNRSRLVVIKARVVRTHGRRTALKAHVKYLQREGVTRDGERAALFSREPNAKTAEKFAERCAADRHHFRFIVSPEDAVNMADLDQFTRDLMKQAQVDLGTRLDWVAVSHWNTEHPHVHILVRGVTDAGDDLVISRDYIKEGLRARAQGLVTDELGPRTDSEIRLALHRQIDVERYTQIDRQLQYDARRFGFVDLAPDGQSPPDEFQVLKAGRMRKLEALGLADQFAPGQWIISDRAEIVLRALGQRGDIIKRIHQGIAAAHLHRSQQSFQLDTGSDADVICGRILARGLDDELKGTAYLVVDATDGRTHHVALPSLEASGDSPIGSIVSLRFSKTGDRERRSARIESDLDLKAQIHAEGSTWLDRQWVNPNRLPLASTGFGSEVRTALEERTARLAEMGLAKRSGSGLVPAPNLLTTLRDRELKAACEIISKSGARGAHLPAQGTSVSGIYRQRLDLASGRFAVLDDGMGFQLVPWSPRLDQHLGEPVSGTVISQRSVAWDLSRSRNLGIEI
jgi:type IV secretory pathway VirD2 relaxase